MALPGSEFGSLTENHTMPIWNDNHSRLGGFVSHHRVTKQRQVILDVIRSTGTHPTVDELYQSVKQRLPRISLATVYRNLDVLTEQGLVKKVDIGGPPFRFDAVLDPHYHVRCQSCGRVDDIPRRQVNVSIDTGDDGGYDFKGYRVEFYGLCPRCRRSNRN